MDFIFKVNAKTLFEKNSELFLLFSFGQKLGKPNTHLGALVWQSARDQLCSLAQITSSLLASVSSPMK